MSLLSMGFRDRDLEMLSRSERRRQEIYSETTLLEGRLVRVCGYDEIVQSWVTRAKSLGWEDRWGCVFVACWRRGVVGCRCKQAWEVAALMLHEVVYTGYSSWLLLPAVTCRYTLICTEHGRWGRNEALPL
jgi:hypothetical protein